MPGRAFDAIVVGLGGMGSATVCELARRGMRVLGLEQFALIHTQGSSHGQTRIIRKAYYEHPDYVPLVRRAYERWLDLEQQTGRHLLTECPCLSLGPRGSSLLEGVRASAQQHQLPIESLDVEPLRRRYPQFVVPDDWQGVLERSAGILYVEECVRAHLEEATRLGATLSADEAVMEWSADGQGVEIRTTRNRFRAARLVLTAGPWAGRLLQRWGLPLSVMRQVPLWFEPQQASAFRRDVFPIFIAETSAGYFYGLPAIDSSGAKIAEHYGAPELAEVADVNRAVTAADEERVRGFLRSHLPGLNGPCRRSSVCLYTLTPDRHFILDLAPNESAVAMACGFSGHGFKFAPAVAEVLADFVQMGRTDLPVSLFGAKRFAR